MEAAFYVLLALVAALVLWPWVGALAATLADDENEQ
jgi:hypothetical protein